MIRTTLVAALLVSTPALAQTEAELFAKAKEIQAKVISIDTHVDIPFDFASPAYDMMKPGVRGQQVHIPTMIEGGLDVPFLIVYMGQGERTVSGYAKAAADAFTKFSAIHRATDELYKDHLELALTAADVRRIVGSGKKATVIGMENGYAIGKDLRLLDAYYDYGARYLGLLHNGHNDLGDSAQPNRTKKEPDAEHNGLSPLGKQVVTRLNELGIMADISHASMKTALDMIAKSKAPVIASHSSVKGVFDHPRNVSDDVLDAIKKNGGVVQIVAFDPYLRAAPAEKTQAIAALQRRPWGSVAAPISIGFNPDSCRPTRPNSPPSRTPGRKPGWPIWSTIWTMPSNASASITWESRPISTAAAGFAAGPMRRKP